MSPISPIDGEIASIKQKHDRHDFTGALSEAEHDWASLKSRPQDQEAFAERLKSAGLLPTLSLQYGHDFLSNGSIYSAISKDGLSQREQTAEGATASTDPDSASKARFDKIMLSQLEQDFNQISRGQTLIDAPELTLALKESAKAQEARNQIAEAQTYASQLKNPALFNELASDGKGSGFGVTPAGQISQASIEKAVSGGKLHGADRDLAVALDKHFNDPEIKALREHGFFGPGNITQGTLKHFLLEHPVATAPQSAAEAPKVQAAPGHESPPDSRPHDDASSSHAGHVPSRSAPEQEQPRHPGAHRKHHSSDAQGAVAGSHGGKTEPNGEAADLPPMLKPAPGHATPSKAEVEKALTIQNGEGPYQCADRLRKLLGYPDNTTDTLALAHLLGKDANGQFRHGQVLEIPSADASEAPAQPDYSPDEQPQRPRFIAPLLAPDQQIA